MKTRSFECGRAQFSKDFYKVGNKNYLTDLDSILIGNEVVNTENSLYLNYTFEDNEAIPKRCFEVKWTMTSSIRRQISGEEKPSPQTRAIMVMTKMMNFALSVLGKPPVEINYIVQTKGSYPYYVYDITHDYKGDIIYKYVTTIDDENEFLDVCK